MKGRDKKTGRFLKGFRPSLKTEFKKGSVSYWRGKKLSREHKKKLSEAHREFFVNGGIHSRKGKKFPELCGINHPLWKGDKVGYEALHTWVARHLGKPKHCAFCQTIKAKKFEWANISRTYKRDLSDWIRLCTKCHRLYDYGKIKL